MLRKSISTLVILILLSLILGVLGTVEAQGSYDPTVQTAALLYDEARTVYLGNLARRDNGVPPLRWNRQLTHASRWFSWDSIANRPGSYCGHDDTQGNGPGYRALAFGYLGSAGWENAFCGYYLTPEGAIQGWMNSPGHRANLLNPSLREIGLGFYERDSDGRGYVTQGFGYDSVYAPVIIENEAISTASQNVNLYIYNRSTSGGFTSLGAPVTQMMVSNSPDFAGAAWETYNANKAWTVTGGTGWRNVYVKTRDRFNRTQTLSDTIYLGATVPLNELSSAQMSTTQSQVTLYNLYGGPLPQVQFSPGWLGDDNSAAFTHWWGNGVRVNDAAAWGGTAFRFYPGTGESFAWMSEWRFPIANVPLVAYFRLKVNNNTSTGEVARISVDGGGTEYGPLSLKGTDFSAANQYQEFAINFTFNPVANDEFLNFQFWGSSSADVYVDVVSIFSAPQAITSPLTWSIPGNNYRGQGVWVRYTNGSQFSAISEAQTCIACAEVNTTIGSSLTGTYTLDTSQVKRVSYAGVDNGPVKVVSTNGIPLVASERVAYSPDGGTTWTSYSELMGLPANQLTNSYTFPWYNNNDLNSQLRFANVGSSNTTVTVTVGGIVRGTYPLAPNASQRISYAGLDAGPVRITSSGNVPIIASMRVAYFDGSDWTSFSEIMGLPSGQLTNSYIFPWYNNLDLNSQLRFGNVGTANTTVTVTVAGVFKGAFILAPNASRRVSYAGLDAGPVRITSSGNVPIIASMRVAYNDGSAWTDFSEMMGMPIGSLSTRYSFPVYNNVNLNTQLRFANLGNATTTVTVTIGGVFKGSYVLLASESKRISYAGVDSGPVVIQSSGGIPIIASERVAYFDGSDWTSFAEMMGLPQSQLTTTYLFPWYNNVDLNSQLRFGVP
jgi:uncharacterized protein YkwD